MSIPEVRDAFFLRAEAAIETSHSCTRIFVDLDGTLIRTDIFVEGVLRLVKQNPLNIFRILIWLLAGRASAKAKVAQEAQIDPASLPYEASLVDYLRERKAAGAEIVLATASNEAAARPIARHLDLFNDLLASTPQHNLKGRAKLQAIRDLSGADGFVYAGNSRADRPIWASATSCILVHAPEGEIARCRSADKIERVFGEGRQVGRAFLKEMRLHQWAKNLLVYIPLLTSHSYSRLSDVRAASIAFLAFCLCAAGVYFLNDLLDLDADRAHPTKRLRPLASGALPISLGIAGAVGFPLVSFGLAARALPAAYVGVLGAYFALTNAYSFFLKRVSTADVITLAILYTVRVVAGAVATGIVLSSWLLGFSVFVFVSLAYLKRYVEVAALHGGMAKGRGYSSHDRESMFTLGAANATVSVLVLALYINSDDVRQLYVSPHVLWLLCILHLYWTNRIWIGARRGKIHDDPIVFALKDPVSLMVWAGFVIVVLTARYVQF